MRCRPTMCSRHAFLLGLLTIGLALHPLPAEPDVDTDDEPRIEYEDGPLIPPDGPGDSAERPEESFGVSSVFPTLPRWRAPYLGTEQWFRADYGWGAIVRYRGGEGIRLSSTEFEYAYTNAGFGDILGDGHFVEAIVDIGAPRFSHLRVGMRGLLANPTEYSYAETTVSGGWLEVETGAPWRGLYLAGDGVLGLGGGESWLITRVCGQYNWHLVDTRFVLSPALCLLSSFGGNIPSLRRAGTRGGFGVLPPDLGSGPLRSDRAARSALAVQLKAKTTLPIFELPTGQNAAGEIRLLAGAGTWFNVQRSHGATDVSSAKGVFGLSATVGLIAMTTEQSAGTVDSERMTPILAVELSAPFGRVASFGAWTISLLANLDPADLIRW